MKIQCLIAKTRIQYEIYSEKMIQQFQKYQNEEGEASYFIRVEIISSLPTIEGEIKYKSQFYDIIENDGNYYQFQYDEQKKLLGVIRYKQNTATILITKEKLTHKEYLLTEYASVYYILQNKDMIFIHGSSFLYQNHGVLLLASSGVGKSTHSALWRKYEDITMVNDDKNFVGLEGNLLYVYGNPWSGKYYLDNNISIPLTDLVYIHRSEKNAAKRLSKKESFMQLFTHVLNTSFFLKKENWDKMTSLLVEKTNGFTLYCDISQEAVITLKNVLEEKL